MWPLPVGSLIDASLEVDVIYQYRVRHQGGRDLADVLATATVAVRFPPPAGLTATFAGMPTEDAEVDTESMP